MPDFDIDFCQDGRDRVIDYVAAKYGARSRQSQIVTFGTMAAKAVVRDVGRVLGIRYGFVDGIAKLIPFELGMHARRCARRSEAREEPDCSPERLATKRGRGRASCSTLARELEGLTRNVGMHAGGVLIAPGKLTDFCPLYAQTAATAASVTQFDKDDVEAVGLVKFDFLGLTTLTILDWAVQLRSTRARRRRAPLDIAALPLDDAATYELFTRGEDAPPCSSSNRAACATCSSDAQPDRFEDIIALVALYRPGPMDLIPDFIERKHGRERRRLSAPALEADPGADLRRDGVPGAGDADRAGDRRLLARRRRPAAPRDGQEEARGDGASSATSSSRARRRTASTARKADADLRPDGEVRRLRLQQVARRRLRAASPTRPRS